MIGTLLRKVRAGDSRLASNHPGVAPAPAVLAVTSGAFDDGAPIPRKHAGMGLGDNVSPPLAWTGVPAGAVEVVLVVEDPDAPLPSPFVHCVATGLPGRDGEIAEGALRPGAADPVLGATSMRKPGYLGPAPIPGHGPHRYVFQVFALDRPSGATAGSTKKALLRSIAGHVIARGTLVGTYER
jgi:Raf kinase inhibitor-like YbhB/YbcL family protein